MAAKKPCFLFTKIVTCPKLKKKNTFIEEFFNEIWLKVGKREYIWIFDIRFEKNILFQNDDQKKFRQIAQ